MDGVNILKNAFNGVFEKKRAPFVVLGILLVVMGAVFVFRLETQKNESALAPFVTKVYPLPLFAELLHVAEPSFPNTVCNISDYGAKGDGRTMNTKSFADAIYDCATKGGGEVLVPAGAWLTGPLHLKDNINLHLDKGSTILFSTNLDDYLPVVFSRYEGVEYYNYSSPLYSKDVNNVAITGEGTLDGQADQSWWTLNVKASPAKLYRLGQAGASMEARTFGTPESGLRPSFIECVNCGTFLIEGVTLVHSPMWSVHPLYSHDVTIRKINIETSDGRNTDGIVIDSSKNIVVEDSHFATGDDAIAIKSGRDNDGLRVGQSSENIIVRNCVVDDAHAALAIGSEISGGVKNVLVENYRVNNALYGIRLKSNVGRAGYVRDVWIQNIDMRGTTSSAIEMDQVTGASDSLGTEPTDFGDIHISNLSCLKTKTPIFLNGAPQKPMHDIIFEDVRISGSDRSSLSHVKNLAVERMTLLSTKKEMQGIDITDSAGIRFGNSNLTKDQIVCTSCDYAL